MGSIGASRSPRRDGAERRGGDVNASQGLTEHTGSRRLDQRVAQVNALSPLVDTERLALHDRKIPAVFEAQRGLTVPQPREWRGGVSMSRIIAVGFKGLVAWPEGG